MPAYNSCIAVDESITILLERECCWTNPFEVGRIYSIKDDLNFENIGDEAIIWNFPCPAGIEIRLLQGSGIL